jgi:hypothetical protein
MAITLEITSGTSLNVEDSTVELILNTAAIPTAVAANISIAPYNNITATTVQEAIEQLADNNFSQSTVPVTNINEGDTWYNTSTDDFYVYRETSVGVFEWVPIILGAANGDSDTLDAGAF